MIKILFTRSLITEVEMVDPFCTELITAVKIFVKGRPVFPFTVCDILFWFR